MRALLSPVTAPQILIVSKPLAPPWNDSGKNLPRDVVTSGERFRYRVLVYAGAVPPSAACILEPLYRAPHAGGVHTPPLGDKLRLLARLLRRRGEALRHFFFAPNPATSTAARLASRLRPLPTVQTVSSRPRDPAALGGLLFADRVVALSRATETALRDAGIAPNRIVRIPPGVPVPAGSADETSRRAARARWSLPPDAPVVLYPGDLEFSTAADTVAEAALRLARGGRPPRIILACRAKTAAASGVERALRDKLAPLGDAVRFLGEVDDMPALLAASDLVVLPADDLYAKMDLPLVLLEAMALGRPVIVADAPPIRETVEHGGGVTVPARDPDALARAVTALLTDEARRARLGEEAARAARTEFAAALCARRHEELYADLLAARRPA